MSVVATSSLIYFIYYKFNIDLKKIDILKLAVFPFACAVGSVVLNIVVVTGRYHLILKSLGCINLRFEHLFKLNTFALLTSFVVPFGLISDGIRAAGIWGSLGLQLATSIRSILYDRLLAVLGILITVVLFYPIMQYSIESSVISYAYMFLLAVLTVGVILSTIVLRIVKKYSSQTRLSIYMREIASVIFTYDTAFKHIGIACVSSIIFAITFWLVGLAFGVEIPFVLAIVVSPILYLAQSIPIFYAGLGAREYVMLAIVSTGLIEISNEELLLVSLGIGLAFFFASLPGVIWMRTLLNSSSFARDPG